jgi:hypothetical protein
MKAIPHFCRVLYILACCLHPLPALAAATNQPAGFRVTVELQDGSKIIGKSGDDHLLFRSDVLGEMKLPLERIRSLVGSAQTNAIQLTTVSGDTLTVRFVTKAIQVDTAFGGVKLPVNLIRRLTVSPLGKPGRGREGLVAWWRGEENAIDLAGTHNGTWLNGASYDHGQSGQAFSFGGAGFQQCVEIPYSPDLINPAFSVEAWIKPMVRPANVEKQDWIFGQNSGLQLNTRSGTTGVYVVFQFCSGTLFYDVVSPNQIPLNTFSHVAGTWDGTTLRLYLNGALNNSRTPGAVPKDSGCDFFIGGVYTPAGGTCNYIGQFFNGLVDEVSIYNRALTAKDIQADYEAGND